MGVRSTSIRSKTAPLVAVPVHSPVQAQSARAHALDHARVSDPDTRLGGAVGGARERAGDTGDGDVGQAEGPLELGAGGLVGVDEDAVVRELAHDEPGGGEALRLPHDEAAPNDLVPPQGDVEHACPLGRAPDQDLRPLGRLRRVADVEDEPAYETARPSVVPAEAEADPQDGSPQPDARRGDGREG